MNNHTLILTAAYNEAGNIERFITEVRTRFPLANILVVEDNSPDGTNEIIRCLMRRDSKLNMISRQGKLGVGSAHLAGIKWAYARGFTELITMDCDFAHKPSDIKLFLDKANTANVIVGTRFILNNSLAGWNWRRKLLTHFGHWLTRVMLGIPFDSTGAFRLYRLDQIDQSIFSSLNSGSYSFFFESMWVFCQSGLKISEVPIQLPARTYGSSKMRLTDLVFSLHLLLTLLIRRAFRRSSTNT